MTRKDYELIAAALRSELPAEVLECDSEEALENVLELMDSEDYGRVQATWNAAYAVAQALKTDNFRFDQDRFLKACGVRS